MRGRWTHRSPGSGPDAALQSPGESQAFARPRRIGETTENLSQTDPRIAGIVIVFHGAPVAAQGTEKVILFDRGSCSEGPVFCH